MRLKYFSWIIPFTLLQFSCKEETQQYSYFSDCLDNEQALNNSDLYTWDISTTENDTVFIQIFFDTLRFEQEDLVNTITFTWFKDKVSTDFNWLTYLDNESELIEKEFTILDKGWYLNNEIDHHWFLIKKDSQTSYIEYIITNPLTIKDFATTTIINNLNDEFCLLKDISNQAKSLVTP